MVTKVDSSQIVYLPASPGTPVTRVETRLRDHDSLVVGYFSGGSSNAATIDALGENIQTGNWFRVRMGNNSAYGMTLNGKAVKVLDVYATEQSQWTITNSASATKNKPKNNVYRTVCQNLLSADIEYMFRYVQGLGIYEVLVDSVYKHVFIPCGYGKEFTELQDALCFSSQFRIASYMDPIYMNVDGGTNNYPLKGQISIAIAAGTSALPVTSVMTKPVRIGENNMNGIEIINEGRYTNAMDIGGCIIDFQMVLGGDDLACLNVWKSDIGEIRGITFKFNGNFTQTNHSVIGYWNTQSRIKQCTIDVSGAGVAPGIIAYGLNVASAGETNQITIKCPVVLSTGLIAIRTGHSVSSLTVTGRPEYIIRYSNSVEMFGLSAIDGGSTYALFCDQSGEIRFASGSLSAQNLFPSFQTPRVRVAASGFTLVLSNRNNKWVNKIDSAGAIAIISSLGTLTKSWQTLNLVTVTAGATAVSLKDGQLNKLYIASGNADVSAINLDIGNYTLAQTGESHVIELSVVKAGSGTINLTFVAEGNITPTNAGSAVALVNNEPIKLIYEPAVARWLILR